MAISCQRGCTLAVDAPSVAEVVSAVPAAVETGRTPCDSQYRRQHLECAIVALDAAASGDQAMRRSEAATSAGAHEAGRLSLPVGVRRGRRGKLCGAVGTAAPWRRSSG